MTNMPAQCRLNLFEKSLNGGRLAFDYQFHPPVGQISHESSHRKSAGNRARRVTKAYALNVAIVKNLTPMW